MKKSISGGDLSPLLSAPNCVNGRVVVEAGTSETKTETETETWVAETKTETEAI